VARIQIELHNYYESMLTFIALKPIKMKLESSLRTRSENKCELCGSSDGISMYELPPPLPDGTNRREDRGVVKYPFFKVLAFKKEEFKSCES